MQSSLSRARDLASAIRYQGEEHQRLQFVDQRVPPNLLVRIARSGLEVDLQVVPRVYNILEKCCDRLFIPIDVIRCFIYPSAECQAECLRIDDHACVIRVSSSIVENFDDDEVAFVLGHELGHFLLDHAHSEGDGQSNIELLARARACEISCDRVGLIAANSLEAAFRAVLKTTSGLSSINLRFDLAAYLRRAISNVRSGKDSAVLLSTHPAMPVRARCLLWFSDFVRDWYPEFYSLSARNAFEKLDNRVRRDMRAFVEGAIDELIERAKEDIAPWIWISTLAADGNLSVALQKTMSERFGASFVSDVKRVFSGLSVLEVSEFAEDKFMQSLKELRRLLPTSFETVVGAEVCRFETSTGDVEAARRFRAKLARLTGVAKMGRSDSGGVPQGRR